MVPGSDQGAVCRLRRQESCDGAWQRSGWRVLGEAAGVLRWCLAALRAPRAPEGRKRADLRVPARPTGARGALTAARHGRWHGDETPGLARAGHDQGVSTH
jgi:hypothetical protein